MSAPEIHRPAGPCWYCRDTMHTNLNLPTSGPVCVKCAALLADFEDWLHARGRHAKVAP